MAALKRADGEHTCGARCKQSGRPCPVRPEPGKKRCYLHGGRTLQVRRAKTAAARGIAHMAGAALAALGKSAWPLRAHEHKNAGGHCRKHLIAGRCSQHRRSRFLSLENRLQIRPRYRGVSFWVSRQFTGLSRDNDTASTCLSLLTRAPCVTLLPPPANKCPSQVRASPRSRRDRAACARSLSLPPMQPQARPGHALWIRRRSIWDSAARM